MDKALADKFSNIIKEIWGIQTEVDRLAHNVIELTAMTDERLNESKDWRRDGSKETTG